MKSRWGLQNTLWYLLPLGFPGIVYQDRDSQKRRKREGNNTIIAVWQMLILQQGKKIHLKNQSRRSMECDTPSVGKRVASACHNPLVQQYPIAPDLQACCQPSHWQNSYQTWNAETYIEAQKVEEGWGKKFCSVPRRAKGRFFSVVSSIFFMFHKWNQWQEGSNEKTFWTSSWHTLPLWDKSYCKEHKMASFHHLQPRVSDMRKNDMQPTNTWPFHSHSQEGTLFLHKLASKKREVLAATITISASVANWSRVKTRAFRFSCTWDDNLTHSFSHFRERVVVSQWCCMRMHGMHLQTYLTQCGEKNASSYSD